jgi:hypothetical protein
MNKVILFSVFMVQALWSMDLFAGCSNPPAIGWPEGGVEPIARRSQSFITINYHDQCSGDQRTTVEYNYIYWFYKEIKRDGPNSGGWRQATASGLTPDTAYKFRVRTLGPDNVTRETYGTFRTLCDAPRIGDSAMGREAVVSKGVDYIEIQYDDRCSVEESTQVLYKRPEESAWTLAKTDPAGSTGWRTARIEGLLPEQDYQFRVLAWQEGGITYNANLNEATLPLTAPCE